MTAPQATPTPARRELREFGLVVGAAFLLLAGVLGWRGRLATAGALGAVGAVLLGAGAVNPARLGPARRAWMALARAMSRVTTPVLMGVVYFAILTPTGLALRLLGRRPLARRRDADTFWVERPPGTRRSDLRRQF